MPGASDRPDPAGPAPGGTDPSARRGEASSPLARSRAPMPERRPRGGVASWADRIVNGDARDVLEALPRETVHLAVTSPPYNLKIAYRGYADDLSPEEYLRWLREVWRALERVLVPGGRFVLNVAPTSIKNFRPIHHDLSRDLRDLGYIMRTEIIWYKQTMGRRTAWGSWRSPSNPHIIPSWEYLLVFSKGQWNLPGDRPRSTSQPGSSRRSRTGSGRSRPSGCARAIRRRSPRN